MSGWSRKTKIIVASGAIGALVLFAATAVLLYALGEERGAIVDPASGWPRAERERAVERPPDPVRWPLTGLDASGDDPARVRIVSVKVENSPAARPQSGLDRADVVYEMLTEGGITRFNALFHTHAPREVGPVRSARVPDAQLVPQYGALFVNSGANAGVMRALRSAGLEDLGHSAAPEAYVRARSRRAPHNLYVDVARIREAASARDLAASQRLTGLAFSPAVDSTLAARAIRVPFSEANTVVWTYDEATRTYLRNNNGTPHMDAVSGEQYRARNVVVMWARTSATGPSGIGGATLDISLVGSNRATIFRDGVRIDATWEAAHGSPPTFRDADGRVARLAPGVTWFQVIPTDVDIILE